MTDDVPCTWCRRITPAAGLCECPHCGGASWCDECLGAHAPLCGDQIAEEAAIDMARELRADEVEAAYQAQLQEDRIPPSLVERLADAGDAAYEEWRDEGGR